MAQNNLVIAKSDASKTFPLRGDMSVSLDIVPTDEFSVTFVTYTAETFVISTATTRIRQLDGSFGSSITFTGKIGIFVTMMFNTIDQSWDITANNITGNGTGSGSSGGSSSGSNAGTPEYVLTPDSSNNITINKANGLSFKVTLSANSKLLNPVGFSDGDRIVLVVSQDSTGARTLSYDTKYALPNAQTPALSTAANALDLIYLTVTSNGLVIVNPYASNFGVVTQLARIGQTYYYSLGVAGQGALNKIAPNDTVYLLRDTKGAEGTGTISGATDGTNPTYTIAGAPVNGNRPLITMYAGVRPSYGKAVLNFENDQTVEIRDIRITGGRNDDNDCRGIAPNTGKCFMTVKNVEITNCNNGMLWGNDTFTGGVYIYDSMFDANGVGGPNTNASQGNNSSGYVHNLYAGHNNQTWSATRSTFQNAVTGHNLKSRAGMAILNQVLCYNSYQGRELNLPNGGGVRATNCIFWKVSSPQGNLIGIGEEGMDTTRTTEYTFKNCRFRSDLTGAGRDLTFVINFDKNVAMTFIDCEFIGDQTKATQGDPNGEYPGMTCVNGIRYWPNVPPVFTLTGGPIGPVLPVGYQPIAMTPVNN